MDKYRVEIDKTACQSFGACIELCPQVFRLSSVDGKSSIEGAEKVAEKDTLVTERLETEDLRCIHEAARACPYNAIHITNVESKERII